CRVRKRSKGLQPRLIIGSRRLITSRPVRIPAEGVIAAALLERAAGVLPDMARIAAHRARTDRQVIRPPGRLGPVGIGSAGLGLHPLGVADAALALLFLDHDVLPGGEDAKAPHSIRSRGLSARWPSRRYGAGDRECQAPEPDGPVKIAVSRSCRA